MARRDKTGAWLRLFDAELVIEPPLTDEQLAMVPAKRGVFLLSGEGEQPIVLLTGASIRGRLRGRLQEPEPDARKRSADLRTITRKVRWKLAGGHFEADWSYLELARSLWPKTCPKLLSWRPAWFVHVEAGEGYPHFVRTREPGARGGLYVGPFGDGRSAERFVDAVQDAFDLCRDYQCLRRSPHGPRCAYGQMGRCLSPCDGSITMHAYRQAVAAAAEFAAGNRQAHVEKLRRRMQAAAETLRFEQAAAVKTRLDRLAEFDSPAWRHAAPLEEFRFLLVQRSGSRRSLNVFLVNRGWIARAKPVNYPLVDQQLAATLTRMGSHAAAEPPEAGSPADRWRIGLVAKYLFAGQDMRGLILRWRPGLTPADLREAIAATAGALGVGGARRGNCTS